MAASAARKAEPSFGPSVEAAQAAACAWPSGVLGSAISASACASAIELTEPSSAPGQRDHPEHLAEALDEVAARRLAAQHRVDLGRRARP